MFAFHKPKIFRSVNGCCICKAKSSSSRFTDSKRYEFAFARCFLLEDEARSGDICNACVLLVKRYAKLPAGSNRHWNHVVDARSGPGVKSFVKTRNKPVSSSTARTSTSASASTPRTSTRLLRTAAASPPSCAKAAASAAPEDSADWDDIKRKHVYRRRRRESALAPVKDRQRNPSIAVSDFLDMTIWKRERVCCGTIFRGPFGEVVIDPRFLMPCWACTNNNNNNGNSIKSTMSDAKPVVEDISDSESDGRLLIDEDLASATTTSLSRRLSESTSGDVDEGFFDRATVSPVGSCSSSPAPVDDLGDLAAAEAIVA